MILVDTSVWVDHLRAHNTELERLIEASALYTHPFIVGELALGSLRQRLVMLRLLQDQPFAKVATDAEVLNFLSRHALSGRGVAYVDVCQLASARLTSETWLWRHDKNLSAVAGELGLGASPPFSIHNLG